MNGLFKVLMAFPWVILALDLEVKKLHGLFCVNSTVGENEIHLYPVIDLASDKNIFICKYSGINSDQQHTYDPRQSESASYEDFSKKCKITKQLKGNSPNFCEHDTLLYDKSILKLIKISDEVKITPNNEPIEFDFFCYEHLKNNQPQTSLNLSIFGLGPGKNSFIREVQELEPEINVLKINLNKETISFTIQEELETITIPYSSDLNQYNLKITELINDADPLMKPITDTQIFLNTLSEFSSFTPNIYFKLLRSIKASLKSDPDAKSDLLHLCYPKDKANYFPIFSLYFSETLYISWKPEDYTYIKDNLICLGIVPSMQNYLGLNFLSSRELSIFLNANLISFEDLTVLSTAPESSSKHESYSESENSSQINETMKEPTLNNSKSSNFFIFLVCVLVILAQIAAGYFFLTRNRNQRLQDPGIDLPPISSV